MLTPLFRATQVAEVRKEKIYLHGVFCLQIVGLYIDLRSKEYDIVDFHLLFTVSNQKGLGHEACLFVNYLSWHQVVVVRSMLLRLGYLVLLIVRHIRTIRLCILYLVYFAD